MATSNRDRVNKGMDLLKEGLYPPVAQMMQGRYGDRWWEQYKIAYPQARANGPEELDVQGLLHMMRNGWRGTGDERMANVTHFGHDRRSMSPADAIFGCW